MSISSWFPWRLARQHKGRNLPPALRRHGTRLACEQLENRSVPATYTAATVPELIAAINLANSTPVADTITLDPGTTFTLTEVNNTNNSGTGLPTIAASGGPLTILGNGDTIERSTASGTPAFRLFNVAPGAALTLANLTLQGGLASEAGGGIYSSGSLTVEAGTIIRGNQAVGYPGTYYWDPYSGYVPTDGGPGYGGGVYVASGTATLTNVTLASNSAQGGLGGVTPDGQYGFRGKSFGGGLYVAGGTVMLTSNTLSSNTANYAGGVYVQGGAVTLTSNSVSSNRGYGVNVSGGVVALTGNAITSNDGNGVGVTGGTVTLTGNNISSNTTGGVEVVGISSSPTVTLTGNTISHNGVTAGDGPGVTIYHSTVSLSHNTISFNTASGGGGGVCVLGGGSTVTMTGDSLFSNTAESGGGLYVGGGAVTLTDVTISSNTAKNKGGGVYVDSGTLTLTGVRLSSNAAGNSGGGMYVNNAYDPIVFLTDVTLTSNTAANSGGGVYVYRATVTLTGVTLSFNTAGYSGGGLYASSESTVTLRNVTVTGNSAQLVKAPKKKQGHGGGIFIDPSATVYINAFTVAHTTGNKPEDIYGSYILIA